MTLRISPSAIVGEAERSGSPGLLARAPHWERVALADVALVVNGAAFSSRLFNNEGRGLPLVRIRDVGANASGTSYDGPFEDVQRVHHGDILVGMDGDFRVARWEGAEALLNQRVCRIEVDEGRYDSRFFLLALQGYLDAIWKATSSVTVKHLSSRSIAEIPLPCPPMMEQRRIVEILEDHLSRLDAAAGDLAGARHLADALRASALKWIWGKADCLTVQRPVEDIGPVITGATPSDRVVSTTAAVLPFVAPGDVHYGQKVVDVARCLPLESYSPARVLQSPAVVAVCIGATLGKIGWVDRPVSTNQQINAVLVGENVPRFVAAMMAGPAFQRQMRESASATTMPILNKGKFRKLRLPLPAPAEQQALLERLDVMLGSTERLVTATEVAAARYEALRRALLAAAFSGRLTR